MECEWNLRLRLGLIFAIGIGAVAVASANNQGMALEKSRQALMSYEFAQKVQSNLLQELRPIVEDEALVPFYFLAPFVEGKVDLSFSEISLVHYLYRSETKLEYQMIPHLQFFIDHSPREGRSGLSFGHKF